MAVRTASASGNIRDLNNNRAVPAQAPSGFVVQNFDLRTTLAQIVRDEDVVVLPRKTGPLMPLSAYVPTSRSEVAVATLQRAWLDTSDQVVETERSESLEKVAVTTEAFLVSSSKEALVLG